MQRVCFARDQLGVQTKTMLNGSRASYPISFVERASQSCSRELTGTLTSNHTILAQIAIGCNRTIQLHGACIVFIRVAIDRE
jgi:hypothetical protein